MNGSLRQQVARGIVSDIPPAFRADKKSCHACGMEDSAKPMCFRGEIWCSDTCKKVLTGQISPDEWNARRSA